MRRTPLILILLAAAAAVAFVLVASLGDDGVLDPTEPRAPEDTAPAEPGAPEWTEGELAAKPDPRGAIEGVVWSADGAVVGGARVEARRLGDEDPPVAAEQTDGRGRFRLVGLPSGDYAILARADGHGPARVVRHGYVEGAFLRVDLRLTPLAAIDGKVMTEGVDPIGGARVDLEPARILETYWNAAPVPLSGSRTTETAPDGSFRLDGLVPGVYDLKAAAEGMVTARIFTVYAPSAAVEFHLREGLSIVGRVRWPNAAFAGIPESFSVWTEPLHLSVSPKTADPISHFRIDGLPPGEYEVHAWASGFREAAATARLERGAPAPSVDLRLERGTVVTGSIRDVDTGAGIPGAEIVFRFVEQGLEESRETLRDHAVADTDGSYRIALGAGLWTARATADGYLDPTPTSPRFRYPWQLPEGTFRVDASPVLKDLELRARYDVVGRVVSVDDGPVPARVAAVKGRIHPDRTPPEDAKIPYGTPVPTESDGSFTLTGLAPWAIYTIRASGPGRNNFADRDDVSFPDGERVVGIGDLVVVPPGADDVPPAIVRGRVVGPDGRPAAGAAVMVGRDEATTRTDGTFEVEVYPGKGKSVRVVAAGHPPTIFERLDIDPGETVELGDLVLPARGARVSGTVTDGRGSPIPDALLVFRFQGIRAAFETESDFRGQYEIEGPAAEATVGVQIEVTKKGYATAREVTEVVTDRVVDIVLGPPTTVTGKLGFADERPSRVELAISFSYRRKDWRRVDLELSDSGKFVVEDAPTGTFRVRFHAPGYAVLDAGSKEFAANRTLDLGSLKMTRGGAVAGRILDTAKRPWEGWPVEVADQDRRAETDEDGSFRLENLAPGDTWVTIYRTDRSPTGLAARQRVTVKEGGTTTIEVKVD